MRRLLLLFVCLFLAFLAGWFFIDYLTVHPLKMALYLLLLLSSLFTLGVVVSKIMKKATWWYMLLAFIGFITGYYINAGIFLNQNDTRFIPELTRTQSDSVPGHTAVVYFTHGEPELYNPIGWLNQFKEFDEQGIRFVPFPARPFFVYMLRNKYLEVGKSNHRQTHMEMLSSLEAHFRAQGDSLTRFYLCFLDDEPRPDAAVIEALNEGAGKIIVATVFLTVSNHTAEGKNLIHEVNALEKYNVPVYFTDPLWDSRILRSAFLDKVYSAMDDTPRNKTAIGLIGHGQPDEWDQEWPTETEQEELFRESIIDDFVMNGFNRELMGSAWMDFKDPKPADLMEGFIQKGAKKIFYFSAAISADAIHSQVDVPRLVHEYDFPDGVEVLNLGAWNNHPIVINAIKERIDSLMLDL